MRRKLSELHLIFDCGQEQLKALLLLAIYLCLSRIGEDAKSSDHGLFIQFDARRLITFSKGLNE